MAVRTKEQERTGEQTQAPRAIVCAACGHPITSESERISIGERHEHRFLNPYGFVFDIGCFREAAGCACSGESSTELTWFPPLAWRVACCGSCHGHIGWAFESPSSTVFFGLVLNRLRSGAT